MDDFDEERYQRGARALTSASSRSPRGDARGSAPGPGPVRAAQVILRDEDREELQCAARDGSAVIRVRALTAAGREQVTRELQLLAALEVARVTAAPAMLEIEDEGYVREEPAALRIRRGRRCAEESDPATAERRAQARARDGLDALIDALHDRGWVLGAPFGEGLGIRADGSVTVVDLSGLRPEEATGARLADRQWVDSVLRDEARTLRRRIDTRGSPVLPGPPPDRAGPSPRTGGAPAPQELHRDLGASAGEDEQHKEQEASPLRPVPAPRASSRPARSRLRGWDRPLHRQSCGHLWNRVREVLSASRTRRIALLSAAAVLIAGGVLGSGAWWLVPQRSAPAPSAGASPYSTQSAHRAEGPRITDPVSLATDLAQARHQYVTGAGDETVTAAGSPAEAADEQVRRAYEGATVEGGGPDILSARVLAGPTQEGTALLEAETSTPAHTVTEGDGSTTAVAATAATTVQLELRWTDGRWRVVDFRPA